MTRGRRGDVRGHLGSFSTAWPLFILFSFLNRSPTNNCNQSFQPVSHYGMVTNPMWRSFPRKPFSHWKCAKIEALFIIECKPTEFRWFRFKQQSVNFLWQHFYTGNPFSEDGTREPKQVHKSHGAPFETGRVHLLLVSPQWDSAAAAEEELTGGDGWCPLSWCRARGDQKSLTLEADDTCWPAVGKFSISFNKLLRVQHQDVDVRTHRRTSIWIPAALTQMFQRRPKSWNRASGDGREGNSRCFQFLKSRH